MDRHRSIPNRKSPNHRHPLLIAARGQLNIRSSEHQIFRLYEIVETKPALDPAIDASPSERRHYLVDDRFVMTGEKLSDHAQF